MKINMRHATIWFQTFGKFCGEPGELFSRQHEKTMFGCGRERASERSNASAEEERG